MNFLLIIFSVLFGIASAKSFTDSSHLDDDGCDHFRMLHGTKYSWTCQQFLFCPKENVDLIKNLHSMNELRCDRRDFDKICCPKTFLIGGGGITTRSLIPPPRTSLYQESESFSYSTSLMTRSGPQLEIQRSPTGAGTSDVLHLYSQPEKQFFVLEPFGGNKKLETPIVPQNVYVDCGTLNAAHSKDNFTWICQKRPCQELPQSYFVKTDLRCSRSDDSKICCPEFAKEMKRNTRPVQSTTVYKGEDNRHQGEYFKDQPIIFEPVRQYSNSVKANLLANKPTPEQTSDEFFMRKLRTKKYSKFDRDLLSAISRDNQNKNVIISPASIRALLALLVEGSTGDSSDEILQVLQVKQSDRPSSLRLLRKLQYMLKPDSSNITLESQNKIYKTDDVKIQEEYDAIIGNIYNADLETLNFTDPEYASSVINTWVKNVTHGLIPALVDKDSLRTDMKIFLLNYIYLKANWDMEFDPFSTHKGCFYFKGECQNVKFMSKKRLLNYTDSSACNAEIFEIPFKDSRYRVVFMLPHKDKNVYDVLKSLEREDLFEWLNKLETTSMNLTIPRTTIDFSSNVVPILRQLGIKSIFGPNAKLDKMVKNNVRVAVNDLVHKARIEINEEGTKAAGVSGGGVVVLSLDLYRTIKVERPFLIFIRDTTLPGFLFEGIVYSPDKADAK